MNGARTSLYINRSAVRYVVAEIPISRKDRRNIWPMLLGLLALVLVLGFLFGKRRVAKPGLASDTTSSTTSATSTGAVADSGARPR
jgi:LPXTG-motif cell wall-anchored protein